MAAAAAAEEVTYIRAILGVCAERPHRQARGRHLGLYSKRNRTQHHESWSRQKLGPGEKEEHPAVYTGLVKTSRAWTDSAPKNSQRPGGGARGRGVGEKGRDRRCQEVGSSCCCCCCKKEEEQRHSPKSHPIVRTSVYDRETKRKEELKKEEEKREFTLKRIPGCGAVRCFSRPDPFRSSKTYSRDKKIPRHAPLRFANHSSEPFSTNLPHLTVLASLRPHDDAVHLRSGSFPPTPDLLPRNPSSSTRARKWPGKALGNAMHG